MTNPDDHDRGVALLAERIHSLNPTTDPDMPENDRTERKS